MTNKPEVMNGESLNIAAQRRDELKQLFPGVFTETKDTDGNIVSSIDFERLKAELGTFSDIFEGRRERYGMDWPGKRDCMKVIQEPSRATLKPCPEESLDWDTTKNLFIEGDNLEVLKLLQKSYYGKVKMAYLDPPYNTGNEFIYPDNYQESLETYLAYSRLIDDNGKAFTTNTASEGRYHSKWLNMMFTRLFLSRNLLTEDGVIFISIDSNEVVNLKRLLDEIYGEENFLVDLIWEKTRKNDAKFFSNGHEYVLVYAKNVSYLKDKGIIFREEKPGAQDIYEKFNELRTKFESDFEKIEQELKTFYQELPKDHPSKKHSRYNKVDSKGVWRDDNMSWPGGNGPNYDVIHPKTGKPCAVPPGGWRFSTLEKMNEMIEKGIVVFREDHTQPPIRKTYLVRDSITGEEDVGKQVMGSYFYKSALSANNTLADQIGKNVFENPKDSEVIKRFIKYICQDDSIILDFFAGSGTTAQAVFEANKESSKNHSYILVQLPEKCDEKSTAFKKGYKKISDITKHRLTRLADIFNQTVNDTGFRKLELRESNFTSWRSTVKDVSELQVNLDLSIDNVDPTATQLDLLFEIVSKAGFLLSEQITKTIISQKTVYSIAQGALLICLEEQLTAELIDEVIKLEPMQFICLDKGFQGNDQLKANTAQAFKARSQDSEAEMVFKVV